jgi:glutamine synthetase
MARTNLTSYKTFNRSRDSVVGTATSYGLGDRGVGVRVPVGSRISSSPLRPDRLWGPPNLLSNG